MDSAAVLAQHLYTALATGDGPALDALLAPDFRGVLADGMPFGIGGEHDGPDAMRRNGWGAIGRHFAAHAEPERFLPLADGRLLVTGRYTGTGRHGGTPLDAGFAHLITVTDGRIRALEQYTDTARWTDAAAPTPESASDSAAPMREPASDSAAPMREPASDSAAPMREPASDSAAPIREPASDSAAPFTTLTLDVADGIATVRLDRPDQHNAIDVAMARDLSELATRLAEDPSVRVVLLLGNGPMLTAGGDVPMLAGAQQLPDVLRRMIDDYHLALERLTELDAPLVVGVRGAAAGGGLGLVGAADYVVAADDAVFTVGYAALGLTADGGNTWFLPRLIGMRRTQEMFLLNRRLTAAEALDWGLVNRTVPSADVDAEARVVAERLANGPTRAFGGMRTLLRQSFESGLRDQLADEKHLIVTASTTPDAREGIAAFAAKRRPSFRGEK
ncbi:MAG: enoyl-CoA hydratase/isomerase family protein [Pseudonocardia sp.]|uniref:enoyl-CoA hydratase-related protein n=2 Tax=unclassified Pseudonocardia TaxID=2619320 RepID=UPI001AC912CE|nr:enoyl-CoA hydratase-related protein [Pseudonocardia sp.]MBN9097449.1 enoyl-CoA hydratase/isomerase family protein [Pseudonocardia sp.]